MNWSEGTKTRFGVGSVNAIFILPRMIGVGVKTSDAKRQAVPKP